MPNQLRNIRLGSEARAFTLEKRIDEGTAAEDGSVREVANAATEHLPDGETPAFLDLLLDLLNEIQDIYEPAIVSA